MSKNNFTLSEADTNKLLKESAGLKLCIAELQAQLDVVKALPNKWRRISASAYSEGMFQGPGMTGNLCADELEAALEQGDE
jgi:hypothetical protein